MIYTRDVDIIILLNFNFLKMIKKITILCILVASTSIRAQELDEKFLESLPESVREDVLSKSNESSEKNDELYRAPLTSREIYQLELKDLKSRIEQNLKILNEKIDDQLDLKTEDDLPLFGRDFFTTFQSSFMPVNSPNLDSTYILDFADILSIQIIGQKNSIDSYKIQRDGSINIPEIGKIYLSGLALNEASKLIKSKINNTYIGTKSYISLESLRDVNILISGNVYRPGIYTLNGNANILHALISAGGIGDGGSYRNINLIRNDEIIETFDVYEVLLTGKFNLKKRLRTGDVIFINQIGNVVTVAGAVKRPAKYELKDNQTLYDAYNYANGKKFNADISSIKFERFLDRRMQELKIVNVSQFKNITAFDKDRVLIREIPLHKVHIKGQVKNPGIYLMNEGSTIGDLINRAGGYLDDAYLNGAIYETKDAKKVSEISSDILYEEFITNLILASQTNSSETQTDFVKLIEVMENFKNLEPNGRVSIDLLNEGDLEIFKINDGDSLHIPKMLSHVYIYGEVSSEGTVQHIPNQDISYYIDKSGGLKKTADKESIFVIHPNGTSEKFTTKRNIFASSNHNNLTLYPGSVIFVPQNIDDSVAKRISAQAYASILSSLGLTLASLSSINNN